ncbi:MAG: class I SAM-dependent methyltransferase [Hyphomicrobiales bacterium]|nr:class I SAM-dependent methyltransferase [Hyphomicrobiales bacterium]
MSPARNSFSLAFDVSASGALMDHIYRHQRHIYDASRKFYLLGRDGLLADLSPPPGGTVLEIGCGTGRNLVKLAKTFPDALCHGLDLSAEMLDTAERAVNRARLGERIRLARADAASFDPVTLFGRERFDRIIISYALSMVPPWREALARAADCLSARGSLHIVDFGDQAGLPAGFQVALKAWLSLFHVTPRETLAAELAQLAKAQGLHCKTASRFRGYALCAVLSALPPNARKGRENQPPMARPAPVELLHLSG